MSAVIRLAKNFGEAFKVGVESLGEVGKLVEEDICHKVVLVVSIV